MSYFRHYYEDPPDYMEPPWVSRPPRHPQFRCDGGVRWPHPPPLPMGRCTVVPVGPTGHLTTTYKFTTDTKETNMTTRKERIEKAERAVIEAAKECVDTDWGDHGIRGAVDTLRKAEAAGPPVGLSSMHVDRAAAHVLRAFADQLPEECGAARAQAREWAEELVVR